MSQENVELVRRMFDAWSQGDFSVGGDLIAEDFEWQQHAEAVEPGTRRGDEIANTFRNIFDVYESYRIVPKRFFERRNKVVVVAANRGTERRSGLELDETFAYVWTVTAGKLARVEVYTSEDAALEAAGLSE